MSTTTHDSGPSVGQEENAPPQPLSSRNLGSVSPLPAAHLVIVSHVAHYRQDGRLYAYGAYAREIDMWAELFDRVTIAAPFRGSDPPADCIPLKAGNIALHPIRETGGRTIWAKAGQVLLLPVLLWQLHSVLRHADAIHVRCPGNLGMLGVILGPLYSRNLIAKYAGQWCRNSQDTLTIRFQRWLLSSRWWRGPVTVYGQWPNQPKHVIPFFTSIMDQAQLEKAAVAAAAPRCADIFNVLFVGRLSEAKNVDVLLRAIAKLGNQRLPVHCDVVGVGPQREPLQQLAADLGIVSQVNLVGGVEHDRVFDYYAGAHALVLASETEGWPKAIAEAMACGVPCIGSNRGLIPTMLGDHRGLLVEPGNVQALTDALQKLIDDAASREAMSKRSALWGQQFSLDHLRDALHRLLLDHWQPSAIAKSAR